jgi:hypothetical protein
MLLIALWLAIDPAPASAPPMADGPATRAALAAMTDGTAGAVYDPTRDADADVAAAFARARANGRMVMIVLGGNWCHDSRALAEHFAEADFQAMLSDRYEIVYVDVGHRDRNLQIPARYGVASLQGTPTVLVLAADGTLLSRGTAGSWRNAASRRRASIFTHFRNLRR